MVDWSMVIPWVLFAILAALTVLLILAALKGKRDNEKAQLEAQRESRRVGGTNRARAERNRDPGANETRSKPRQEPRGVGHGDPGHGFVMRLGREGIRNSGLHQAFSSSSALRLTNGSREVVLGNGSPTGHHIVMSVFAKDVVMIMLGEKPHELGGTVLGYATPESPFWTKVTQVLRKGGKPHVLGIPGIARMDTYGSVTIYIVTG